MSAPAPPHSPDYNCSCMWCFLAWIEEQANAPPYEPPAPLCYAACECGALEHPGDAHHVALAIEDVQAHTDCDCPGYFVEETGEVVHDGYCTLTPYPPPEDTVIRFPSDWAAQQRGAEA